MNTFKVFTDASSRYKAVIEELSDSRLRKIYPSSIGAVIKEDDKVVGTISERIGFSDSNYAEFLSMYTACRYLIDLGVKKVDFYVDCMNLALMVNQGIMGVEERLRKLSYEIRGSLSHFEHYTVTWISRSHNKEAHDEARKAFKVV